jgi:hypothetical protein
LGLPAYASQVDPQTICPESLHKQRSSSRIKIPTTFPHMSKHKQFPVSKLGDTPRVATEISTNFKDKI